MPSAPSTLGQKKVAGPPGDSAGHGEARPGLQGSGTAAAAGPRLGTRDVQSTRAGPWATRYKDGGGQAAGTTLCQRSGHTHRAEVLLVQDAPPVLGSWLHSCLASCSQPNGEGTGPLCTVADPAVCRPEQLVYSRGAWERGGE